MPSRTFTSATTSPWRSIPIESFIVGAALCVAASFTKWRIVDEGAAKEGRPYSFSGQSESLSETVISPLAT
jgi:hypothetical protein